MGAIAFALFIAFIYMVFIVGGAFLRFLNDLGRKDKP